jgi:hypothetical protein
MGKSTTHARTLFRELERRRVAKTSLLYIVLCWGALGVCDVVLPTLEVDANRTLQVLLYAAIAGMPIVFAFAWFFQITPRGIVRSAPFVDRRVLNNISPINDKRGNRVPTFFGEDNEGSGNHWVITAESGLLAGLSYGISQSVTLGRSTDCDITLPCSQVSRHHARLYVKDGSLKIKDLGASNGSKINGEVLEGTKALHQDDELSFHDTMFRVSEAYAWTDSKATVFRQATHVRDDDT